jgi:predicted FMN-binding regulatory protein PaiB
MMRNGSGSRSANSPRRTRTRVAIPWTVDDAPADFIAAQRKAIVGIEIPIARIEGKWKVSQNRPAADRIGVVTGLRSEGADAIASAVAERSSPSGSTRNSAQR